MTVSDKNGILPSQTLAYKEIHDFQSAVMNVNGSSSSRMGLEWVLDFDRIKAINTSIRIDGKYYRYKGIDEVTVPSTSSLTDTDGQPYKYIGYYVGGNVNYNGFMTQRLNTNLTLVTHVPKIRMIFSLRFEGTLLKTRQNLSEYSGGTRSYVLDSQSDYLPRLPRRIFITEPVTWLRIRCIMYREKIWKPVYRSWKSSCGLPNMTRSCITNSVNWW